MSAAPRRRTAALLRLHFDRDRLPDPERYYTDELGALLGRGTWRDALCPFHRDTRPSLRVNTQTGAYRCMACGASGGDVLAFQRQRYEQGFVDACRALGCWVEGTR
jgi:hypothetical protein